MELLANLLSHAATSIASSKFTVWMVWDEPTCPEDLL